MTSNRQLQKYNKTYSPSWSGWESIDMQLLQFIKCSVCCNACQAKNNTSKVDVLHLFQLKQRGPLLITSKCVKGSQHLAETFVTKYFPNKLNVFMFKYGPSKVIDTTTVPTSLSRWIASIISVFLISALNPLIKKYFHFPSKHDTMKTSACLASSSLFCPSPISTNPTMLLPHF